MLQEYKALDGQSAYDVCMILYGTLDHFAKLCSDSGLANADTVDLSGYTFVYDTELVNNQAVKSFLSASTYGTNYYTPDVACPIVTGLTQDSGDPSSITASWNSNSLATGFQYALTGTDTPPTSGWTSTTDTSVTITGLMTGATYFLWLRTLCGPGSFSGPVSISVATTVPMLTLWTSPWLDPSVTNPSPGDFMPYAIPPISIFTGFTLVTIPAIIIEDETGEDDYLAYLNSGFDPALNGAFSRTDGVFTYEAGTGEMPAPYGSYEVLYAWFVLTFDDMTAGKDCGFRYQSGGGANTTRLVIDWDDTSDLQYIGATGINNVPHEFEDTATEVRVFHNNKMTNITFREDGAFYPVAANLLEITGLLPSGLGGIDISECPQFATSTSNISDLDISMCPNLVTFSCRVNSALQGFSALFTAPHNFMRAIIFKNNVFNATVTDGLINDFVNNSWGGITNGTFTLQNAPPAAPTAASLTSRTAIAAAAWTQAYDP